MDESLERKDEDLEIQPVSALERENKITSGNVIVFSGIYESKEIEQEVPMGKRRYSIEFQCQDFLDVLISTTTSKEIKDYKLREFHKMIERYKQLRKIY